MMRVFAIVAMCAVWAVSAEAQTIPKNPSAATFTCVDHALDTEHELDIIRKSDNVVLQTILLGDPPADTQGIITAKFSVQPIAFGTYYSVVRAVAGGLKSINSPISNDWERVPGQPSKPIMARALVPFAALGD